MKTLKKLHITFHGSSHDIVLMRKLEEMVKQLNLIADEINRINRQNVPVVDLDDFSNNCRICDHAHAHGFVCNCGCVYFYKKEGTK